ncbi:MAG: transcriptional regulator [Lawsonibacter sp.]|nr:transcriptional regulator [Lawsonibacter sp.]
MTGLSEYEVWCLAGLLLCAGLLILRRWLARLVRLALRSSAGLAVLALLAQAPPLLGVNLGVNLVNALVLGLLGVPGLGLLLMLQWVLR